MISGAAIVIAVLVSKIDYHRLMPLAGLAYVGALVLMGLVKSPLGVEAYGARRWFFSFRVFQFQLAEVAKIAVIIFCRIL